MPQWLGLAIAPNTKGAQGMRPRWPAIRTHCGRRISARTLGLSSNVGVPTLPMHSRFRFSHETDWRHAPLAYWVHVQNPGNPEAYDPPAPPRILHHGYALLRVEFGPHELVFSSPEQLAHCIAVLATQPLPTPRALSARRGTGAGPNGHWLSRLPADLKRPATRSALVRLLKEVYVVTVTGKPAGSGKPAAPPLWPGLSAKAPGAA